MCIIQTVRASWIWITSFSLFFSCFSLSFDLPVAQIEITATCIFSYEFPYSDIYERSKVSSPSSFFLAL